MDKKNYMTPVGHKKLSDELAQLWRVERPEVTKLVQWAASNGDRSENADYIYGKKRLREIDRRIRFLSARLEMSQVIDPSNIQSTTVQFGATVKIQEEQGIVKTFSIVGVDEIDTAKGYISWQSPIGRSLLGKSEGDEVLIRTPAGEVLYEVVEIIYKFLD
jgi:transcription elongation factor GreB